MAKQKNKQTNKGQTMDGLGVSFEDAMNVFAQPVKQPERRITKIVTEPMSITDTNLMLEQLRANAKKPHLTD
jgi:hypothetical protein